jgi:hypothetical protein
MTLEQVGANLGASSYSAVAMQVGRFQRQLPQSTLLKKRLQAVAKRLNVQCLRSLLLRDLHVAAQHGAAQQRHYVKAGKLLLDGFVGH